MNARDELFQLMLGRTTTKAVERILAAGYRKPRTINSADELDALPVESAVVDWTGRVYQKDAEDDAPELPWWMMTGDQRRYPAKRITLPATVLHEPQP